MTGSRHTFFLGAMTLALAACGGGHEAELETVASDANCVTLEEGYYYWDGEAFAVGTTPVSTLETVPSMAKPEWHTAIEQSLADAGYPWLRLVLRRNIAVLVGLAPDETSKAAGLAAGTKALEENPVSALEVSLIVDGITAENGTRGPGQSLAALMETSLGISACQAAFDNTMRDRKIRYQSEMAIVSPVSNDLLDALSGVATLCDAYRIEIGEHTDNRGHESYNMTLSQQRAGKIRDYMLGKGVPGSALFAKGYGESTPVDTADTPEARDRNQRTEFKVTERQ